MFDWLALMDAWLELAVSANFFAGALVVLSLPLAAVVFAVAVVAIAAAMRPEDIWCELDEEIL